MWGISDSIAFAGYEFGTEIVWCNRIGLVIMDNIQMTSRVAVFGEDRGFFEELLCDYELKRFSLPTRLKSVRISDALHTLSKPRSLWQSEYVQRQFERTNCRLLVSTVDNAEYFGYCSNLETGRRTIAIQNGLRLPETEWLYSISRFQNLKPRPEFQHDIYIAWGSWDADRYLGLGGSARQMIVAGSLADALHRKRVGQFSTEYEIGVLELRSPHGLFDNVLPFPERNPQVMRNYSESIRVLFKHLERFRVESGIRPHFILNSTHDLTDQLKLLDQLYSGSFSYSYSPFDTLASYDGIMRSEVVVGVLSSLLVEAFGRGKKILALNPSGSKDLNFPIQGLWTLQDNRYEAFKERLQIILHMSEDDWTRSIGDAPFSLVAYDSKNPTDIVLKDLVKSLV